MTHYQMIYIENPPFFNITKTNIFNIRAQSIKILAFQKIGVNNVSKFSKDEET